MNIYNSPTILFRYQKLVLVTKFYEIVAGFKVGNWKPCTLIRGFLKTIDQTTTCQPTTDCQPPTNGPLTKCPDHPPTDHRPISNIENVSNYFLIKAGM